jgi:hypothetical protein
MQMLGVQVLFGFQFQGLFQAGFKDVSLAGRRLDALGLALMIVVLGCLVAVPCQHRLVDQGMSTRRIQRVATKFADIALLPFAVGIGCALFVAVGRAFGAALGAGAAIVAACIALAAWYGLGFAVRGRASAKSEINMSTATPLHTRIDQMLLGFQLIVLMTPAFDQLPYGARIAHIAALAGVLVAVILLIAPAAVHRIAFGGTDAPQAYSVGTVLVTWALAPLAIGICCDFYLALTRLLEGEWLARACAAGMFVFLLTLWYVVPLLLRRSRAGSAHT